MEKAKELVVIGGSAGSYNLIVDIIESLPLQFSPAIVVVIHRNPKFTTKIEETLSLKLKRAIVPAKDKMQICSNMIYFAIPGYHLLIEPDSTFSLDVSEPVQFSRPSIDVLFETSAEVYCKKCIAFLLSGANKDGTDGFRRIQEMGGKTYVQSPEDALITTMPEHAIRSSHYTDIFSDQQIISYFRNLK
ncbi:chemotaxis protein CheB [Sphingobacterium sp. LRF_L2]|uniref:chemotaxis protein CheB n=1 Tax=Sphingobacterium sp. LRF_L2 TaxID=3369421 RepID=UPI003F5D9CF9